MQRLETINSLLLERRDGRFVFFHAAFREWLSRRDEGQSNKFMADSRYFFQCFQLRMYLHPLYLLVFISDELISIFSMLFSIRLSDLSYGTA